jgi:hypothetical protein
MATRSQTYAIRLAVEGGGQVKAELVSVGQSVGSTLGPALQPRMGRGSAREGDAGLVHDQTRERTAGASLC